LRAFGASQKNPLTIQVWTTEISEEIESAIAVLTKWERGPKMIAVCCFCTYLFCYLGNSQYIINLFRTNVDKKEDFIDFYSALYLIYIDLWSKTKRSVESLL
jgi:hypothetical protein